MFYQPLCCELFALKSNQNTVLGWTWWIFSALERAQRFANKLLGNSIFHAKEYIKKEAKLDLEIAEMGKHVTRHFSNVAERRSRNCGKCEQNCHVVKICQRLCDEQKRRKNDAKRNIFNENEDKKQWIKLFFLSPAQFVIASTVLLAAVFAEPPPPRSSYLPPQSRSFSAPSSQYVAPSQVLYDFL